MRAGFAKGKRAFVPLVAVFVIIILLFIAISTANYISQMDSAPIVQGQPMKDPVSGLYTVYVIVNGHRDYTIFHTNFHSNIHLDFVFYYFLTPPIQPSGQSILGFNKPIHIIITLTGSSITSAIVNTFDVSVSVGAKWGVTMTYTLPSGTYDIDTQGVDQDGFRSSLTTQLTLP
ncbi:MAG: hypothetical protein V1850_03410 [Candidatus Bathyarchaeota archaeon]